MRNFWIVFKQTFKERITSKSFLLTTVLLVIIAIMVISLPSILNKVSNEKAKIVFITDADISAKELNEQLPNWAWKEGKMSKLDKYKKDGGKGKIKGIYLIHEKQPYLYSVEYYTKAEDMELLSALNLYLQMKKMQEIATNNQLSPEDQQALMSQVAMKKMTFNAEKEASSFIAYFMIMLLFIAIMMYGTTIATAVASEKASRVMEVMVTKVNPISMIFGKILGIALASLTQFIIFFVAVALYLKANIVTPTEQLGHLVLDFDTLTIKHFIYFFTFFLLGYLLYASVYAVFGSMVSRPEDLNGTTTPVNAIIMASTFSAILFAMKDPTSIVAKALSIIPFSSPFNMIILIMSDTATSLEIGISIGLLLITTFAIAFFAAKIYPKGILHFGENLKLRQLITRSQ